MHRPAGVRLDIHVSRFIYATPIQVAPGHPIRKSNSEGGDTTISYLQFGLLVLISGLSNDLQT